MTEINEIVVLESIYDANDRIAQEMNKQFTESGTFVVNVMGAPGAGKTSSLIQIITRLEEPAWVIEGDIESDIDTKKLLDLGVNAVQINTGGACHLDAPVIEKALSSIKVKGGMLFIENIGNLVCPAEFVIGEHIKLLISTVADGSDKPYKYPLAFEKADIILINKSDLMQYVDFDMDYFMQGVKALNKTAPVFAVSSKTGVGFDEVTQWLKAKAEELKES